MSVSQAWTTQHVRLLTLTIQYLEKLRLKEMAN